MFESASDRPSGGLLDTYDLPPDWERHTLHALGTENVLLLRSLDAGAIASLAHEAFDLVSRLERSLSKFDPESELALVNQAAQARPIAVGPDLLRVLELARDAWIRTGGAFDPCVGPLLEAWGLVDLVPRRPSQAEIEAARELAGFRHVELDLERGTVSFLRPGPILDLGGIGKGYIVDRVVDFLREGGVSDGAVVAGRSTIAVWGHSPAGDAWRAGIAHPHEPDEVALTVELDAGVLSTSGASERRLRLGAEEWGHVVDPRSGAPVRTLAGATVWTSRAVLGDVLSTALFVLGGEAAREAGGPLEDLVAAWAASQESQRASFLWFEDDPAVWGGVAWKRREIGAPGFRVVNG